MRYSDTDQMGYMHHSNYLRFFEIARLEWLSFLGVSYKDMEKNGIWLPVVSAAVQFKKPAFFDDALRVKVTLLAPPQARLSFAYEVFNENDACISTGHTDLAFLDAEKGKPMRCPKNLLQILKPYF